jgi:hypothetical protein
MGKPAILAGLSAIVLVAAASDAAAQSCGSEIERLAQQYNLSTTPQAGSSETNPAPPASSGASGAITTAERAARGGGVTAPPDTGTTAPVQPPAAAPNDASNAADTAPPPAAGRSAPLAAGDRARMEGLVQQALAAERQGKATECLDLLRRAASLPGLPGAK